MLPEYISHEGAMITTANILWSAAKYYSYELLSSSNPCFSVLRRCITKRVERASHTAEEVSPACIANLAWAYGTFLWGEPIVLSLALTPGKEGCRIHGMEPRHIVSVLWAAARTDLSASSLPLWQRLDSMIPRCNEQDISNSLWALLRVVDAGLVGSDNKLSFEQYNNLWGGLARRAQV